MNAVELFLNGFTCSQAVAAEFAEQYGMDLETIQRVSRGFGGGMGGTGGPCGAITGAYMALGMGHDPADRTKKTILYEEVQEFNRRFLERHGNTDCRDLLGLDVSSEAGKAKMKEKGLLHTHCSRYVNDAVEIVKQIVACR